MHGGALLHAVSYHTYCYNGIYCSLFSGAPMACCYGLERVLFLILFYKSIKCEHLKITKTLAKT